MGPQRVGRDRATARGHMHEPAGKQTLQWPKVPFPKSERRVWNEGIPGPGRTLQGSAGQVQPVICFLQSSGSELYLLFQIVERGQENNIL